MGSNQGKPSGGSNACWNPLNTAINAALGATSVGGATGNSAVDHLAGQVGALFR